MSTVVELAIVLGIMVLVHEFGHFALCKLCGVRVEAFAIGFGKRIVGFRSGGTEYRLNLLPLGGYVKMAGEMPGEAKTNDPGELQNHPRWQRALIALAGPFANFLLAIALMAGVYMAHDEVQEYLSAPAVADYVPASSPVARTGFAAGDRIVRYDTVDNPTWDQVAVRSLLNLNQTIPFDYLHDGHRVDRKIFVESKSTPENFSLDHFGLIPKMQNGPIEVSALEPGMPAEKAGLKAGDKILTVDGHDFHSVQALLAYLQDRTAKPVALVVNRAGQKVPLEITPKLADAGDGTKDYRLGFRYVPPPVVVRKLPFGQAIAASWQFNWKAAKLIGEVIKRMFTRQVSVKSLSGPIGIGQQVHEAVEMPGWLPIVSLMAYISVNLGIFNLLPIPILDGGMILFLLIEEIIRRDIDQSIKERVYQVAFVCIVVFAAFVIFNDISKLGFFAKLHP